jgi:hypothetical protein
MLCSYRRTALEISFGDSMRGNFSLVRLNGNLNIFRHPNSEIPLTAALFRIKRMKLIKARL